MVSGAVLSTIYISQNTANWFMSSQNKNMEVWEYSFVSQLALNMAGYMISHNIILCKEKGWSNSDTLCKWNDNSKWNKNDNSSLIKPSDFHMKKRPVIINDNGEKILSLEGTVNQTMTELIANPSIQKDNIKYRVTFDLVNWKDNSIQSIIGGISSSACRNMNTLTLNKEGICPKSKACTDSSNQYIPSTMCELDKTGTTTICMNTSTKTIHNGGICPQSTACKDNNNQYISNTQCESIANTDQDYSIVFVSVTTPLEDNNPMKKQIFAGIRRPLSMPLLEVLEKPACKLSCPSNNTTISLPECRGEFTPDSNEVNARLKVRLINPGPGAIYKISLLRKDRLLNPNIPQMFEFSATEELVEQAGKEVLLPGEDIEFYDFVDCTETVDFNIATTYTRDPALAGILNIYTDLNPHATPFKEIFYSLLSLQNSIGVCMADDTNLNVKLPVKNAVCPREYKPNNPCKTGGQCYYSTIEPNRYINNASTEGTRLDKTNKLTSITIYRVPPH